jgi:hypothetical protein
MGEGRRLTDTLQVRWMRLYRQCYRGHGGVLIVLLQGDREASL